MSDGKDFESRRRAELIKAITAGLGLASQAVLALSGAMRRAAQAIQELIKAMEEKDAEQPTPPTPDDETGATGPTGPPMNP